MHTVAAAERSVSTAIAPVRPPCPPAGLASAAHGGASCHKPPTGCGGATELRSSWSRLLSHEAAQPRGRRRRQQRPGASQARALARAQPATQRRRHHTPVAGQHMCLHRTAARPDRRSRRDFVTDFLRNACCNMFPRHVVAACKRLLRGHCTCLERVYMFLELQAVKL